MRLLPLVLLSASLFGCDNGGFGNGDGENPDGVDGTQDLDDPNQDIVYEEVCDGIEDSDGNFQPVTGATRYYVGAFNLEAGDVEGEWSVSGTESLILFANEAWLDSSDTNAMDCEIVWSVFGTATGTEASYTISASARLDEGLTTCNIAFAKEAYDESQELEYGVTINTTSEPWTSYFTFASGSELGSGQANAGGVTYTSNAGCQFY
jgi:hypothetical protein